MKNILVPTDFSKNALNALYYAIEFAKKENAKLFLLNVYNYPVTYPDTPHTIMLEEMEALKAESEEKLKGLSEKIAHAKHVPYEIISEHGTIIERVLDAIDRYNIDAVIMGTKGTSDLVGKIFGSIASAVIEKAKCPVITVPMSKASKKIKKITYATTYTKKDLINLKKVVEIAKHQNAQVNVLHITGEPKLSKEEKLKMKIFMDTTRIKSPYNNMSFQILPGESVEKTLKDYVDHESTNLLAMTTNRRGPFEKIFKKSNTKRLANYAKVPLLAFH